MARVGELQIRSCGPHSFHTELTVYSADQTEPTNTERIESGFSSEISKGNDVRRSHAHMSYVLLGRNTMDKQL